MVKIMKSPHYLVQSSNPASHIFEVTLHIEDPAAEEILWMPTWIPGSYLIREFARNVMDIKAKLDRQSTPQAVDLWRP